MTFMKRKRHRSEQIIRKLRVAVCTFRFGCAYAPAAHCERWFVTYYPTGTLMTPDTENRSRSLGPVDTPNDYFDH